MRSPQMILEINTRLWLNALAPSGVHSLADIPERFFDQWEKQGFDAIWLMGVWKPSPASRKIALTNEGLADEFRRSLPDVTDDDISASPYALLDYKINIGLGGDTALLNFRERLRERHLKLILDFVPNHMACDCSLIFTHPEWFVLGSEQDLAHMPGNWFRAETKEGERIIAHGRDPYFAGWTDTAQLDITHPDLQKHQRDVLKKLTEMCDGVRCDMAMLVTNSVFARTWNRRGDEFWPRAIHETRQVNPDFAFIAEVYWGMERELREMGFDLTYDKELLDTVIQSWELPREMFNQPCDRHRCRLRFLENHDEPRIASRMETAKHHAAAAWLFSLPSSRLVYDGQMEGFRVRPPVQLVRAPMEASNPDSIAFYEKLLLFLKKRAIRNTNWKLLEQRSSWSGNDSYRKILGQAYDYENEHLRVFMNWADHRSQCWVDIQLGQLSDKEVELNCALTGKVFVRDGMEIMMRGLYLDMEPWEAHLFDCTIRDLGSAAQTQAAALPDVSFFASRF